MRLGGRGRGEFFLQMTSRSFATSALALLGVYAETQIIDDGDDHHSMHTNDDQIRRMGATIIVAMQVAFHPGATAPTVAKRSDSHPCQPTSQPILRMILECSRDQCRIILGSRWDGSGISLGSCPSDDEISLIVRSFCNGCVICE